MDKLVKLTVQQAFFSYLGIHYLDGIQLHVIYDVP